MSSQEPTAMPTANASPPAPRLDTLPSELVLVVCKFLLNRTHKLPQQWPSREASADFAHLARAAPNCYAPALTTAVRYVNRFCLVKPNPDLPGAWIVINERLLRAHDLVGCIALDVFAPRVTDKHGVSRPPVYLVIAGSFKDGIPPRMTIPVPATAIRYMKVVFSTWLFDYIVPPHLTALTLEGCKLEKFHVNLLVVHLPTTLRQLWLDAIQISSRDLGTLLRQIPAGVRDLAIIDMHIDDETAEILVQSFPLALTHLQLASTQLTNAGLMTVISALPADRLELLDFGSRQQHTPATLSALAAWIACTTRLTHLTLENALPINSPYTIDVVLGALPATLRSLTIAGSRHSTSALAASACRLPQLETLDLSRMRHNGMWVGPLLPALPATLRVLRFGETRLQRSNIPDALAVAHKRGVRWPDLVELDMQRGRLTFEQVDAILEALKHVVEPRRKGCRTRVLVGGNALSVSEAPERWASDGWDVVL